MAARASFSNDSKIVKVPLPKSVLLKDYLLDDLSSCSSNGFRSYPRRQCFTTVRYLIEIDLNKHIKLPPTQKQFLKTKSLPKQKLKSKSKSSSVLQKASAVVVNVFKNFQFSGSDKRRKTNFLPRNLSRKLSKHGFWKRTTNHGNYKEFIKLNSFNEPIKPKENLLRPPPKAPTAVTTTTVELKITSTSNSNSSVSSLDSYFSPTYDSSTTGSCSKISVAQNDVEESERQAKEKKKTIIGNKGEVAIATATKHSGNAKVRVNSSSARLPTVDDILIYVITFHQLSFQKLKSNYCNCIFFIMLLTIAYNITVALIIRSFKIIMFM